MGKVLNYRDYLEKLETELNDFESELNQVAEENGVSLEDVIDSLDTFDLESYEWLQKRIEKLKRWEATEQLFGAYRRAERMRA